MNHTLTAQLSEEAQEALEFLQQKNVDVNRTINRIVMRVAQEEGWHISLVPGGDAGQEKTAAAQSPPGGAPEPMELQPGDDSTHLIAPVEAASHDQPKKSDLPVPPTPAPAEKPFEPGVILAETMADQSDSPQPSSVVKKTTGDNQ